VKYYVVSFKCVVHVSTQNVIDYVHVIQSVQMWYLNQFSPMCCAVHAQGVEVDGGEGGKKGRAKVKRGKARLVLF